MLNSKINLNPKIFDEDVEKIATRSGFGDGLLEIGELNENIVALTADLSESTKVNKFAEKFPSRFFEAGITEQNLVSVASGMAAMGKIPFASSYAVFSPGRNWEQIRTTICYNNQPVKIIGSHAGLMTGPDGGTHQALEDIAITRVLPNMVVISPCDYEQAKKATIEMSKNKQPTYLRLCRANTPVITTNETPFEIGKAQVLFESESLNQKNESLNENESISDSENKKITIISTGFLLHRILKIAKRLDEKGISLNIINVHTIKPLDTKTILDCVKKTNLVLTLEEHQVAGGLGSAVSEFLSQNYPVKMKILGVNDEYGQSGEGEDLLDFYGLSESKIEEEIWGFV